MKKLITLLALIAYAFSDQCEDCRDECKVTYKDDSGNRQKCIYNCILDFC